MVALELTKDIFNEYLLISPNYGDKQPFQHTTCQKLTCTDTRTGRASLRTVTCRGKFGIVLNDQSARDGRQFLPTTAHLILDRYSIDDDGQVSLTAPLTITDIFDFVNDLKGELDALVDEVLFIVARDCALHLTKRNSPSNDNSFPHPFGGEAEGDSHGRQRETSPAGHGPRHTSQLVHNQE